MQTLNSKVATCQPHSQAFHYLSCSYPYTERYKSDGLACCLGYKGLDNRYSQWVGEHVDILYPSSGPEPRKSEWSGYVTSTHSLVPRRFFAQHSSIVSIKIVSGFSTCNNNRTNYSLWKLEREIEWMMRFFWKIRQRTHDDSKRYSRAQTNVRARGSSAPPWAPPHVHVK